jgi:hypothetical protein
LFRLALDYIKFTDVVYQASVGVGSKVRYRLGNIGLAANLGFFKGRLGYGLLDLVRLTKVRLG